MTLGANAQLDGRGPRHTPSRDSRAGVERPQHATPLAQGRGQARASGPLPESAPARRLGPAHVERAGAVAGLASHVDLRPGGSVAVGCRVVVLADIRRMAVRAHVVPVLLTAGPVQLVAEVDALVRIEVKPALPARLARARIPDDRQRLEPAAGQLDQVLLEWSQPEGVLDLEVGQLAV